MTSPYAKAMAHAVINDDEVALQALMDKVMEESYQPKGRTYWFYLLKHTGIGPDIHLLIPPEMDVVDLDWFVKATTLYEVVMMTGTYHFIRPLEGAQFLPEFINIGEVVDRIDNVASTVLKEYIRVCKDDDERTTKLEKELKKRSRKNDR